MLNYHSVSDKKKLDYEKRSYLLRLFRILLHIVLVSVSSNILTNR
jgi:hypothetical protein